MQFIEKERKSRKNLNLKEKCQTIIKTTSSTYPKTQHKISQNIKHLNIQYFKTIPCNKTFVHNHKACIYYHTPKDRKRIGNHFSSQLCKFIEQNKKCPNGQQCRSSHSRVEQLYQAETYKTKFCSHYPNNIQLCQYQQFCSFAHNESEIIIELIHNYQFDDDFYMFHYKTVFCPFNLTEHNKSLCVYAHNWQDFRRKPNFYFYQPLPCINWKLKSFILDYVCQGCPSYFSCNMCHGWKQYEYHPLNYRTKKCNELKCRKGQCNYYHTQKQKRTLTQEFLNKQFRIIPRNRIVEGVFKHQTSITEKKQFSKTEKENSMIQINNTKESLQQLIDKKFKSTVNIKNHKKLQIEEQKWIPEGILHQSDDEEDQTNQKQLFYAKYINELMDQ